MDFATNSNYFQVMAKFASLDLRFRRGIGDLWGKNPDLEMFALMGTFQKLNLWRHVRNASKFEIKPETKSGYEITFRRNQLWIGVGKFWVMADASGGKIKMTFMEISEEKSEKNVVW